MRGKSAWIRNPEVVKRTIVGKTILLAPKSNYLLVLNEQAASIWNALNETEPQRECDIMAMLRKEYADARDDQLEIDVRNNLDDLRGRGFAHRKDGDVPEEEKPIHESSSPSGHLSFSEELHTLAAREHVPISGGLELTQRCHLKCIHCYINDQPTLRDNEWSTEEACALLDQMAKSGCLWLLITGGEPLLRKDFAEIYRSAKKHGMIVTIFTSATNISRRVADTFVEYPPFLVEATLHGATETTFEMVSGIPGSFRRFKRGIKLLRDRRVPFHLKMIVMRQNVHEVEATRELALELGAQDFRFDPTVNADLLHSSKVASLRVSVEEAAHLDLLEPYRERWERVYQAALEEQSQGSRLSREILFPCRAGKCSFTVSADGQLLPCILMRAPTYDLRKMSFREAWDELNRYTTGTRMRQDNPCRTCPTKTCSRCPAWGALEHGDPDAKSSFACELQRTRESFFLNPTAGRR